MYICLDIFFYVLMNSSRFVILKLYKNKNISNKFSVGIDFALLGSKFALLQFSNYYENIKCFK